MAAGHIHSTFPCELPALRCPPWPALRRHTTENRADSPKRRCFPPACPPISLRDCGGPIPSVQTDTPSASPNLLAARDRAPPDRGPSAPYPAATVASPVTPA